MGWACPCCTLNNDSTAAACGACEQPRPPAQAPEVIDLLDDDEGGAPQQQQQQQQQAKTQRKLGKQQRQEQQEQRQQGDALQHKHPAAAQPGGRGGTGMGAPGSKSVDADDGKGFPSSDDSFQIELSDVTSSKRRRTQGTAGSGSVKKQQLVGSAAAAGNGSGSSAETAALAGAVGGGGKSAAPRLPPRQPRPSKGAAAAAAPPCPLSAGKDEPAGSITSGSRVPLQDRPLGEAQQRRQEQRELGGKRARDGQGPGAADGPSPAGLAGLSLPPSKKQRRAAGSGGAVAPTGAAAPLSQQLSAAGGGRGHPPVLAAQPSGLSPLPLRHAKLSQQVEHGTQAVATAETQAAAVPPRSATGSPDLPQEPPSADVGVAPAALATGGSGPGRPPPRQLPPAARGLPVPLKPRMSSKHPGQHQQEREVQQQQQQKQQQQPVQASPHLPPRPSTAQGSSRDSPVAGAGLVLGVQHQVQLEGQLQQQEGECSPESMALGRQHSSPIPPPRRAGVEQQAHHDVRQELAAGVDGGEGEQLDEQQDPPAVGPLTFWQGLEAAYGAPCAALAQAPPGTGATAGAAGSAPAWVRRARQSAVDATAALLAAATGCPPLELEGQGQHPRASLAAASQGWLAFRLAARLPEAVACRDAEEVLDLGASAAAAAGPPPPLGAALAPRRQQGPGAAAVVGMCHVASRLLAAASRYQAHPMKLEERTRRWFQTRTPTFRKTLCKRLGDAFASTGGAGSDGGRRGGKRGGGGAAHGLSRLGKGAAGGGAGAARRAKGGGPHRAPAGRSEMKGVQRSVHGTFWATSSVQCRQLWLGTYSTQAAAGHAVDLVWAWKWARGGRRGTQPAFNIPGNAYLQDKALLERLEGIEDPKALIDFIKAVCGVKK